MLFSSYRLGNCVRGLRSWKSASFSSLRSGGSRKLQSSGAVGSKLSSQSKSSVSRGSIQSRIEELLGSDGSEISGASGKANRALTKEYVSALEEQAKQDAEAGVYGKDGKANALRDAQMKKYVSPDRDAAIAQVSKLLTSGSLVSTTAKLSGLPYTASVIKGRSGTTAEIYDESGEPFARYDSKNGKWESVTTKAESQFKTASSSVYDKAYRAAQSKAGGGADRGTPSGLDVRV